MDKEKTDEVNVVGYTEGNGMYVVLAAAIVFIGSVVLFSI